MTRRIHSIDIIRQIAGKPEIQSAFFIFLLLKKKMLTTSEKNSSFSGSTISCESSGKKYIRVNVGGKRCAEGKEPPKLENSQIKVIYDGWDRGEKHRDMSGRKRATCEFIHGKESTARDGSGAARRLGGCQAPRRGSARRPPTAPSRAIHGAHE